MLCSRRAGLKPDSYKMALENCSLCRGTGWKLVPRTDGTRGNVAVACDCGMEERATRTMERARVPKRYEHCDFESYVTDLVDGKTWTTQHSQSLKNAKLLTQGFVRDRFTLDTRGEPPVRSGRPGERAKFAQRRRSMVRAPPSVATSWVTWPSEARTR